MASDRAELHRKASGISGAGATHDYGTSLHPVLTYLPPPPSSATMPAIPALEQAPMIDDDDDNSNNSNKDDSGHVIDDAVLDAAKIER
jgi:hypothetical protein